MDDQRMYLFVFVCVSEDAENIWTARWQFDRDDEAIVWAAKQVGKAEFFAGKSDIVVTISKIEPTIKEHRRVVEMKF